MSLLPDPERARRNTGLVLFLLGTFAGGLLLLSLFIGLPILNGQFGLLGLMGIGAGLAFPAGAMYLTVPRLLDRYDPEPWYALVGCLLWGGVAACGFSAAINTAASGAAASVIGVEGGEAFGAVVSAPIVEELWKALGVFGVFFFLRREFDGVVDGIIYATFIALGFATVENVIYYARAAGSSSDALATTFLLRGVIAPWGHPVYTSMTGIGFGLARETEKAWVRGTAPTFGYAGAVLLHMLWNGSATLADYVEGGNALFLFMLPVWLVFVTAFLAIVLVLVRRRGRIIRTFLEDEVATRTLTKQEVDLVCSAFGHFRARALYGRNGVELVRAAARLALSKWHSVRANNQRKQTVSMDFVVPLRQKIKMLKAEIAREAR